MKVIKIIICLSTLLVATYSYSQENKNIITKESTIVQSVAVDTKERGTKPINTRQETSETLTQLKSSDYKTNSIELPKTSRQKINADDTALYIGFEGGLSIPVIDKIKHLKADVFLKKSNMYSGRIGYNFYPGMNIELSATYQPKYNVVCTLLANNPIPSITDKTKINTKVYMVNLIYDFAPISTGLRPYVIGGIGVAKLKIFPKDLTYNNTKIFKIPEKKQNCRAWQIGLGLTKEITPNFFIDCSVKLQVVHNIKINYETLDIKTRNFVKGSPIKTKAALGEYGIGFIYKIPL